jgi:hypothetical protein
MDTGPEKPEPSILALKVRVVRRLRRALGIDTEIQPRIAALETRQDALNDALAEFATRFDLLLTRLGRRQTELLAQARAQERRGQSMADTLEAARVQVASLDADLQSLDARLAQVTAAREAEAAEKAAAAKAQDHLAMRIDDARTEARAATDSLSRRLEDERLSASEGLARLSRAVAAQEQALREAVGRMSQSAADLESRIVAMGPEMSALGGRLDIISDELSTTMGQLRGAESRAGSAATEAQNLDGLQEVAARLEAEAARVAGRLIDFDREFARVDTRLVEIDAGADSLTRQIDTLRQSAATDAATASEIGRLAKAIEMLSAEAQRVSTRQTDFDHEFARVDGRLVELNSATDGISKAVTVLLEGEAARTATAGELDRLAKTIDMLSAEAGRVSDRLGGFDREFSRVDSRLVEITTEVDKIGHVERDKLSLRIDDLARRIAGPDAPGIYAPSGRQAAAPARRRDEPFDVFISSYGRTATYWLAQVLNAHPDVICSHGPTTPPIIEYGDETPVETDLFVWDNMDKFFALSLDEALNDMHRLGKAKFYIKVHSYSAYNLYNRILTEGCARPLGIANLLRHPVTRVDSLARRWRANAKTNPRMRKFMLNWWRETPDAQGLTKSLANQRGVDLSRTSDIFFAAACLWLRQDREDLTVPILHVPCERLVEDLDYFAWFAGRITGGKLKMTPDYLDHVRRTGPKNASGDVMRSALSTWTAWAPWQRAALAHVAELYGLRGLYDEFQYDLSFVA